MKRIETHMTERKLVGRLETLCRKKERFSKGYEDQDVFVYHYTKNGFILEKHLAYVGRTHGYAEAHLHCRHTVNEKGFVTVEYNCRKSVTDYILYSFLLLIGLSFWIMLLMDWISGDNVDIGGMVVALAFWAVGLFGLFRRSRKDRIALEKHLLRICEKTHDRNI